LYQLDHRQDASTIVRPCVRSSSIMVLRAVEANKVGKGG
jgi:hypothetical protein